MPSSSTRNDYFVQPEVKLPEGFHVDGFCNNTIYPYNNDIDNIVEEKKEVDDVALIANSTAGIDDRPVVFEFLGCNTHCCPHCIKTNTFMTRNMFEKQTEIWKYSKNCRRGI